MLYLPKLCKLEDSSVERQEPITPTSTSQMRLATSTPVHEIVNVWSYRLPHRRYYQNNLRLP